jgi:hypothetical protein
LALGSIKAGRPLTAAQRLEGVDATKLIAIIAGALQEWTHPFLLSHQETPFARPPAIRESVPEVLPGQAQLTGNPLCFCQIQANLVAAAALTAAKTRDSTLDLSFR